MNREAFKDRFEEIAGGALLDFLKAAIAQKAGHSVWVRCWTTEVDRLLNEDLVALLKGETTDFNDRHEAINEVVVWLKSRQESYAASASRVVAKELNLERLDVRLDDEDFERFWARVERVVQAEIVEALEPCGTGASRL